MERPCLNDKNEYPDAPVLARHLGDATAAWDSFQSLVRAKSPVLTGQWRFYNDGKSWLFKLTKKKQTICWVSIWPGAFKTTFYFGDKAAPLITTSKLPQKYIAQYLTGQRFGKIRSITIVVKKLTHLNVTKTLIQIKEQLK